MLQKAGGMSDDRMVHLTKKGVLRIVAKDNAQRNRLLKLSNLSNISGILRGDYCLEGYCSGVILQGGYCLGSYWPRIYNTI